MLLHHHVFVICTCLDRFPEHFAMRGVMVLHGATDLPRIARVIGGTEPSGRVEC
jgi:hypothetical protein